MNNKLSLKQAATLIKAVGHTSTVLVIGEMGIGKSALLHGFRADPYFAGHHIPDAIMASDLSDGSVYMPSIDTERGTSAELPNEFFGLHKNNQKGVNGSKPVVLMIDELGKAKQYIKNILAPVLYERRVGRYHMPEGSIVFACTNMADENLGDDIQAHLRNRVKVVYVRKPTQAEWMADYAIPNKLEPELLAATEMYPQLFDSYDMYLPGGKYEGKDIGKDNPWIHNPRDASQEQCATPRSLRAASNTIRDCKATCDDATLQSALEGDVGVLASELTSFIRFGRDMPSFARVVADPAKCPLPTSPVAQLICVFQMITQSKTREEVTAVVTYTKRMRDEMQTLLINRVANSSGVLTLFCTNNEFGLLLEKNRKFLTL